MFQDRQDGGVRLARALAGLRLRRPIVLGIPRGGVAVGAAAARGLGADLDIVLARKLRAPNQPELAIGALGEDGAVHVDALTRAATGMTDDELLDEIALQRREIERRSPLYRAVRPRADVAGRDVIVVDDGLATGETMAAALRCVRAHGPRRLIGAAPVGAADSALALRPLCDEVVCPVAPRAFRAVGEHYRSFPPVSDEEALALLRAAPPPPAERAP